MPVTVACTKPVAMNFLSDRKLLFDAHLHTAPRVLHIMTPGKTNITLQFTDAIAALLCLAAKIKASIQASRIQLDSPNSRKRQSD